MARKSNIRYREENLKTGKMMTTARFMRTLSGEQLKSMLGDSNFSAYARAEIQRRARKNAKNGNAPQE